MFDLMLTPDGLGWVKDRNCADKYILIEHIDLIGFGYDLSDTQNGLRCWGNGIYIFVVNVLSS